jgi:ferredoxin
MRLIVDATKCQGYGKCAEVCPEVFIQDEWGFARVESPEDVPPDLLASALAAREACPERAIRTMEAGT